MTLFIIFVLNINIFSQKSESLRTVLLLDKGWKFLNSEVSGGERQVLDTKAWQDIEIPHDWAIGGPFDEMNDVQLVKVIEDGESVASKRSGRTGGLPHVGIGWYRKTLNIPQNWKGKRIFVEFDGAMSHAKVFLNGTFIGEWPYGYASFGFDLTGKINFGNENLLAVRLENKPNSSRWYPGAGIYRNVRLVVTNPVHVKQWGTYITTPDLEAGNSTVKIITNLEGVPTGDKNIRLTTNILNSKNQVVGTVTTDALSTTVQQVQVKDPVLWSVTNPYLYKAESIVTVNGKKTDKYETPFGFRYFKFTTDNGFFLNGKHMKLQGVCIHHDLGALGAAVNVSAIKQRLDMLKDMGCNAIRTSHNPPAPELLDLCDQMGFVVIDEAFDEWKNGKTENGYGTLWDKWAEKDLTALIHRDRNHPCIILWSVGNEIREQGIPDGSKYCQFLVDICRKEDPTRPTTAAFNNWDQAIKNGLAGVVDIPAWNYKPQKYGYIHENHPGWAMYASETASTVSSRGEYFFPATPKVLKKREPYQASSYDIEYPSWATSPDTEFAAQDTFTFMGGEFVWTGFDYLGEPTPFNDVWPSRSSYFGIIDLAGLPKDRFYLYQSKWSDKKVLHLLPHWNWEGMEGMPVPVHCYTNYNRAELFVNGISMGIREKNNANLYSKYRLVWDQVPYQPGELKVNALDKDNKILATEIIRTAGIPAKIILSSNEKSVSTAGKELVFVTATIVDNNGIPCPKANDRISFSVQGSGKFQAADNGDATCLESFADPVRSAFNGKCVAIFRPVSGSGEMTIIASSPELREAVIKVKVLK